MQEVNDAVYLKQEEKVKLLSLLVTHCWYVGLKIGLITWFNLVIWKKMYAFQKQNTKRLNALFEQCNRTEV